VRWAVRGTLVLGVAASVAANILHAQPDPVAQIIAAWPPLALLLTVELISRVPVHRRVLAAARLIATTAIAGIAAWVSYWHMAGVASRYGEQGASPFVLPLSVDGLVIVASVSLVELAGRIRAADTARTACTTHDMTEDVTAAAGRLDPFALAGPGGVPVMAAGPARRDNGDRPAIATVEPAGAATTQPAPAAPVGDAVDRDPAASTLDAEAVGDPAPVGGPEPVGEPGAAPNARPVNDGPLSGSQDRPRVAVPAVPTTPSQDRPPAEPRAAIAYWHAKDPTLKPGDIAAKVGRSRSTVRRILAELADSTTTEPGVEVTTGDRANRVASGVNGTANSLADSYVSR
jgi:hypothetical protein